MKHLIPINELMTYSDVERISDRFIFIVDQFGLIKYNISQHYEVIDDIKENPTSRYYKISNEKSGISVSILINQEDDKKRLLEGQIDIFTKKMERVGYKTSMKTSGWNLRVVEYIIFLTLTDKTLSSEDEEKIFDRFIDLIDKFSLTKYTSELQAMDDVIANKMNRHYHSEMSEDNKEVKISILYDSHEKSNSALEDSFKKFREKIHKLGYESGSMENKYFGNIIKLTYNFYRKNTIE